MRAVAPRCRFVVVWMFSFHTYPHAWIRTYPHCHVLAHAWRVLIGPIVCITKSAVNLLNRLQSCNFPMCVRALPRLSVRCDYITSIYKTCIYAYVCHQYVCNFAVRFSTLTTHNYWSMHAVVGMINIFKPVLKFMIDTELWLASQYDKESCFTIFLFIIFTQSRYMCARSAFCVHVTTVVN